MTLFLILLLSVSVFMILFGHFILSMIDRQYVYPKRLARVQPPILPKSPRQTPPELLPPAMVSMLYGLKKQGISKKGNRSTRFTVTLLDLIHRGKISVVRDGKRLYLIPNEDESDLLSYEITLLRFVQDAHREIERLSVAKLKGYIEEHRESAAKMRSRFLREMMDDFQSRGFYQEIKCRRITNPLVWIGGAILTVTVGVLLGWTCQNIPLGVITLCFAGFAAWLVWQIFSYDLTYFTEKGANAMAEWEAYEQYIDTLFSSGQEKAPIEEWSRIAVYSAAMEKSRTFQDLVRIWSDLPEYSLECELYDPYFYNKLSEIDYAILISNAESADPAFFKPKA